MHEKKIKDKILFATISILLLTSILVIFVPVILTNIKNKSFYITSSDPMVNNIIKVGELTLTPGTSKISSINLKCINTGGYLIRLEFKERGKGNLKDYLNVIIKYNNEVIFEDKLNKVFDNKDIYIDNVFLRDDEVFLEVIYILPEDIGNEAQGAKAKFDIKLIIKQE